VDIAKSWNATERADRAGKDIGVIVERGLQPGNGRHSLIGEGLEALVQRTAVKRGI